MGPAALMKERARPGWADCGKPSGAVRCPAAACRRRDEPWGWGPAAVMEERGAKRANEE